MQGLGFCCVHSIRADLCKLSWTSAQKGQQRWVYDPPFGEIRAMAANHGSSASPTRIVVGAGSGRVEELNVKARQQWWEVEETRTIVSSEVDSRLDVVLDSYGSRLAFVWDLLILLVELLRACGELVGSFQ